MAEDAGGSFYSRLPRAIGCDIILISSDMHYLHVYTTLGKCMILGTIRDAAEQLGDDGVLVHRSHWVAHKHVNRLSRRGRSWECVMSNDQRVPVSRRNQGKVSEWYGRSGNVVSLAEGRPKTANRRR
jgi:DNA-binding LytR/AlgR family response regulator